MYAKEMPRRAVFVVEYAGPLVIYLMFYLRPKIVYGDLPSRQWNTTDVLLMIAHTFHYSKRLFESIFVHRISNTTMPIANLFRNSIYYWGFGAVIGYYLNHPQYQQSNSRTLYVGLAIFIICELGNFSIHMAQRNLRPAGTRVKAIPQPTANPLTWPFSLVSCPNYTYEIGAWLGFAVMSWSTSALIFMLLGGCIMTDWAIRKHKAYYKQFPSYPRNRRAIFPFLL